MTITQCIQDTAHKLEPAVGINEAKAMARAIVQDIKGYSSLDIVLHGDRPLLPETIERIDRVINKILSGMPMQYALGVAQFHGRQFSVTPDTLIPRPETSQLVDIIVKDNADRKDLRILDIGTGSGCIAISLALDLPFSQVTAIDISSEALKVAEQNARNLRAKVRFLQADILKVCPPDPYDIIVSNPPYVMESERAAMDSRVKDYEPPTALFVPDNDPLIYYKAIVEAIPPLSAPLLYFELNPLNAEELARWLSAKGFQVDLIRDYRSTLRFLRAKQK